MKATVMFENRVLSVLNDVVDIYIKYRPPKLQRMAGLVVLTGVGLLIISFNDYLFELIFTKLGFSRDGIMSAVFSMMLILLGLIFLLMDVLARRVPSHSIEQDKLLLTKFRELLPWEFLNHYLNNVFNHWFSGEELKKVSKVSYFLEDNSYQFVEKRMKARLQDFSQSLEGLRLLQKQYFFPSDMPRSDSFHLMPLKSPDRTGQFNEEFSRIEKQLHKRVREVEGSYQALIEQGRELGLIQILENY